MSFNISRFFIVVAIAGAIVLFPTKWVSAEEAMVYNVYRPIDMGDPGGEKPLKDYYISAGTGAGLHVGSMLDVYRRVSTYDLVNSRVHQQMSYPIAKVKVIHVEDQVAIARLDSLVHPEKNPIIQPPSVMVGDFVRPSR